MKKISMLLIAGIMAMSMASCSSVEEDPQNKPLSPSDQGTYMINTFSALVDQVETKDFQPIVDLIKRYQGGNFQALLNKNQAFAYQLCLIISQMVQPDSSLLISLPPFNGKYTISRDSIITVETAQNIQIVDNAGSQSYILTLDYSGDTHILPITTGGSAARQVYANVPENLSLSLTCDGKTIAAIALSVKATLHGTLDQFDSTKDAITISGSANLCGYILTISNASLKDGKINIAANLKKSELTLIDLSFDLSNVLISGSQLMNMGEASANLSLLGALQVKATSPSFLAIVAMIQQFNQIADPTQKEAQEYADIFNQLFSASVYYNSEVEQSKLFLTPYYSLTSEKWVFLPGVQIGDQQYTLSSYEGFFTDSQIQNLMMKIINLITDFTKLFLSVETEKLFI